MHRKLAIKEANKLNDDAEIATIYFVFFRFFLLFFYIQTKIFETEVVLINKKDVLRKKLSKKERGVL